MTAQKITINIQIQTQRDLRTNGLEMVLGPLNKVNVKTIDNFHSLVDFHLTWNQIFQKSVNRINQNLYILFRLYHMFSIHLVNFALFINYPAY